MKVSIQFNARTNRGKIFVSDNDVKERLYFAFSTPNTAKKFVKGPMKHWIQDNVYFITPTGTFNFGLAEQIITWFKANVTDRPIEWEFDDAFKKRFTFEKEVTFRNNLNFEPREYQEECVKLALKHHFGTFVLGTGAGKTFTIASTIDNLFSQDRVKRVMILVPDNNLVLQFNDELVNQYGLTQSICLFYDKFNTLDKDAQVVIANRPLFMARYEQYKKQWQDGFDCIIVDEAHSLKKDNKVSKCVERMRCEYRFGFTGTLAENPEDKFKTIGLCGPVRYEKTSKELRDDGFLSDVTIHRINLIHTEKPDRNYSYDEEMQWLEENEKRNDILTKLVCNFDKNTLLLVNHLEYGHTLLELFTNYTDKKNVFFIRGEIETSDREEIRKMMEVKDNVICIAVTKIFSTGINIKNLHNIVLCSGGKSAVTIVQSIGRGLRLHPNKKELNIVDIVDVGCKYAMRHAEARGIIYKRERIRTKEATIEV